MKIVQGSPDRAPLNLLTLADPSPERIQSYLKGSTVFLGEDAGTIIAVAVLQRKDHEIELMNIAVAEQYQGRGFGQQMLTHVRAFAESRGATRLNVGTGNSSIRQLEFYQKCGFRITGVITDFFRTDSPPIIENDIRCLDMILLSLTTRPPQSAQGRETRQK